MSKRVLIIEDETAAAVNLQAILRRVAPSYEVLTVLESIEESVEYFNDEQSPRPDLVFMDIHLADGESFRIFDRVDIKIPIIFTTAYDEYALRAFKVNSIDYILKPINEDDMRHAIEKFSLLSGGERQEYNQRVEQMVHSSSKESAPAESREVPRDNQRVYLVHQKDKIIPLSIDDVAFFYTANEKVSAVTYDGTYHIIDRTLESLQASLPDQEFFRANRQFIIARKAVKDITIWFGSRLSLNLSVDLPEKIIIPKARVPEFKQWLMTKGV